MGHSVYKIHKHVVPWVSQMPSHITHVIFCFLFMAHGVGHDVIICLVLDFIRIRMSVYELWVHCVSERNPWNVFYFENENYLASLTRKFSQREKFFTLGLKLLFIKKRSTLNSEGVSHVQLNAKFACVFDGCKVVANRRNILSYLHWTRYDTS
jgi:hypothetical protein